MNDEKKHIEIKLQKIYPRNNWLIYIKLGKYTDWSVSLQSM